MCDRLGFSDVLDGAVEVCGVRMNAPHVWSDPTDKITKIH